MLLLFMFIPNPGKREKRGPYKTSTPPIAHDFYLRVPSLSDVASGSR
jgi:hypothetical protein